MHPHRTERADAVGPALELVEREAGGPEFTDGCLDMGREVGLIDAMKPSVSAPDGIDGDGFGGL